MSGGGLAVDSSGDLYLTSGNGSFDANTGGKDYGMALVKLSPKLNVLDYFSPYNEATLSNADEDYGCGNAVLLPTQPGSAPDEATHAWQMGRRSTSTTPIPERWARFTNPPNGPNKDLAKPAPGCSSTTPFLTVTARLHRSRWRYARDYSVGGGTLATTPTRKHARTFGGRAPRRPSARTARRTASSGRSTTTRLQQSPAIV